MKEGRLSILMLAGLCKYSDISLLLAFRIVMASALSQWYLYRGGEVTVLSWPTERDS